MTLKQRLLGFIGFSKREDEEPIESPKITPADLLKLPEEELQRRYNAMGEDDQREVIRMQNEMLAKMSALSDLMDDKK